MNSKTKASSKNEAFVDFKDFLISKSNRIEI